MRTSGERRDESGFEVDPRFERLLHWRYHFAEGEMWAFGTAFDARVVAVVRRARRIDQALALCSPLTREVLFRAYGARPDGALESLSPQRFAEAGVLRVEPVLCNLVELAPEAEKLAARVGRAPRQWLVEMAAKHGAGQGRARGQVGVLLEAAWRVLARAAEEYAAARGRVPEPARAAARRAASGGWRRVTEREDSLAVVALPVFP